MENFIIKEKLSPNIKRALWSNFTNSVEAIRDLIDNSVGHRIPGKVLKIDILFPKNKISIIDKGGTGMTLEDLDFFFNWGGDRKRTSYDIGLYSVGGKAAIGFLGNSFAIQTSPAKKQEAYRIEDLNIRKTSKLKQYQVIHLPASWEGYTAIDIGDLRVSINKDKLKELLRDTYRPLLEKGEIEIFFDKKKIQVAPFPLDEDFEQEKINFKVLKDQKVTGWISRLAPRSGIKGGMRCYYRGRLICDREFFGHPDPSYKGTLNFLFGEVHLDFVPVNTNKTNFLRNSEEWIVIRTKMHEILKSHIDELLGREIEEPTKEEIQRVKKARDIYNLILKLMKKAEKGSALAGIARGQKPPQFLEKSIKQNITIGKTRSNYRPATPPPKDAIGKRKRLRRFMDWTIRPMGEQIRSKIEKTEQGKLLIINNKFPGYRVNKGHLLYLLETAALQTTRPLEEERLTPKEYLEAFDEHFYQICIHLDEAKETLKKKRRKDI